MKVSFPALVASLATTFLIGNVFAQNFTPAQPTGSYYYVQDSKVQPPSPSDVKPEPPKPAAESPMVEKENEKEEDDQAAEESKPEPYRLIGDIGHGWTLTGFVEVGSAWNNHGTEFNGPVTFADREEFRMHQLYVVLEKKMTECCGLGGRVDVLYGTDYIFTEAAGLERNPNGTANWSRSGTIHSEYGIALPQFYLEMGSTDMSVKVGHFYTPAGYEVVPATGGFFFTHAMTHMYGEPFTHTGVLATKKVNDQLTVLAGAVNGWDKFDAVTDKIGFLGGFTYTFAEEKGSFVFTCTNGEEDGTVPATVLGNRFYYNTTLIYNVNKCVQYVFSHDNGQQENDVVGGTDQEWYSHYHYLFYTINDCWKAGMRYGWFRDDDGARVIGIRENNPVNATIAALGGFVGDFQEISVGLNWTPNTNLIVRPELRWDWFDGDNPAGSKPFDNGNSNSQFMAAIDAIILF